MEIIDLTTRPGRAVTAYGSEGFTIAPVHPVGRVGSAVLEGGGVIGRHEAVVDQLLVVVSGRAVVSGADGETVEIGPGQAARWAAGELHETRALTPVAALIVEGAGVAAALRG